MLAVEVVAKRATVVAVAVPTKAVAAPMAVALEESVAIFNGDIIINSPLYCEM